MVFENNLVKGPSPSRPIPRIPVGVFVFDQISAKDPKKVIVIDSKTGQEVTYDELKRVSIKSAVALQELGITKDDFVVLFPANTVQYLTAFLGALYIGCKTTLLNPGYTIGELHHILSLCTPKLALCSSSVVENLLKLQGQFGDFDILLNGDDDEKREGLQAFQKLVDGVSDAAVQDFRPSDINPDEEVVAVMSSGTTGLPKTVALTHDYFISLIITLRHPESVHLSDSEIILGYLPFFHMFGLAINLISVITGAKLILMEQFVPDQFLKAIQDYSVSKLLAVPPILLFLAKSPLVEAYDLSSVADVVCGAAPLPQDVEMKVNEILNLTVRQLYGATEVQVCTCVPKGAVKPGSVGNPNVTFTMKICDVESRQSLGPWKVGEICVKGHGKMKRYYGNEDETRAFFGSDGFCKTGDLGYYDEDGYFYVVDRLKEIIKYKGFQVAPAELEGLLVKHPGVKEAGVIGIPEERAGEVPLAFVVKDERSDVTEEDLVNYIAENVSDQKRLRGGVRFVKEIPKNASGKILRRELKLL